MSTNYNRTGQQLVEAAMMTVGVLDPEGGTATTTQLNTGMTNLNLMLKNWVADGLQLWERKIVAVFLDKGATSYTLGANFANGGANATLTPYVTTGNLSGTTLIVANPTGIVAGSNIGMVLNTGYLYWTTVVGTPVGTSVTVAAAPTTGSVIADSQVFSYVDKLFRPLRVLDGYVRQTEGNDVPVRVISKDEYNRFGQKTSMGTSVQVYYDPQMGGGVLYVYPVTQTAGQVLYLEVQSPIADIALNETADLPQEWLEAIMYNLALRLALNYGVPTTKYKMIQALAKEAYDRAHGFDTEAPQSTMFAPDNRMYYNQSN